MASYCEDSPVKKKKKQPKSQTQRQCLIHVNGAKGIVSAFSEKSWTVSNMFCIFYLVVEKKYVVFKMIFI